MPHRAILTERQRSALFDLPTDEPSLRKHYTLADDDLEHIGRRRRDENRLGFALQLCALRYPGRVLQPGELIPSAVVEFIGAQLGIAVESLLPYAARRQTRQEHMTALRSIYGYRTFAGRTARNLKAWLDGQAEEARSNEELARRLVEECRRRQVILPAVSTLERLCADAAVAADRRIEERIASRLDAAARTVLDGLLSETLDNRVTRFVWLRQSEPGNNAAVAGRLLDRLEFLQRLGLSEQLVDGVPSHRVARLRRQGERHFADGLREMLDSRRLAILAVCAVEWQAGLADSLIETHDRIVGRTWREAEKLCHARIDDARTAVRRTLRSFADLGQALIEARHQPAMLEQAVSGKLGWDGLSDLVVVAERLTDTMSNDPLAYVAQGHGRLRRYAPRMLRALDIQTAPVARPLLDAARLIRDGSSHSSEELCRIARERDILTLVDGAQTFGVLDLDLRAMGCDFFTGSSHKWLMGPKESGVLYMRSDVQERMAPSEVGVIGGRIGASRVHERLGQRDDACIMALGEAIDFHTRIGKARIESQSLALATTLKEELIKIPGIHMYSPTVPEISSAVVTFRPGDADIAQLTTQLYERHGIACATRGGETAGFRLSPHIYNSEQQVETVVGAFNDAMNSA